MNRFAGVEQWIGRVAILLVVAGFLAATQAALEPPRRPNAPSGPPPTFEMASSSAGASEQISEAGGNAEAPQSDTQQQPKAGMPNSAGEFSSVEFAREHFNQGTAFFVDARPLRYFTEGHVAGAFHLDFAAFGGGPPDVLDMLRGFPLIVYCTGGDCDASHKVKEMLEYYGFDGSQIYIFLPGYPGLEEGGLPIDTGQPRF